MAIEHEKQIKAGSRKKKLILIESLNPEWMDLSNIAVKINSLTGLPRRFAPRNDGWVGIVPLRNDGWVGIVPLRNDGWVGVVLLRNDG